MAAQQRTIALFGSSLNPPTYRGGHFAIVQHFSKIFSEVWVLPVYKHSYASKKDLLPFHTRCELAQLTFQDLHNVHVKTYEKDGFECFMKQPVETRGIDYGTVDILHYLTKAFPDQNFAWILGADGFNDILAGKWDRGDQIFTMPRVEIALITRPGVTLELGDHDKVATLHTVSVAQISSTMARACTDASCLETICASSSGSEDNRTGFFTDFARSPQWIWMDSR